MGKWSFCENSKKKKKNLWEGCQGGGSVWEGVMVDVNGEVKFLLKLKKKYLFIGGRVGSGGGGGGGRGLV